MLDGVDPHSSEEPMPTDQDPRPVLVAVDQSDSARDAVGWAADVAAD